MARKRLRCKDCHLVERNVEGKRGRYKCSIDGKYVRADAFCTISNKDLFLIVEQLINELAANKIAG